MQIFLRKLILFRKIFWKNLVEEPKNLWLKNKCNLRLFHHQTRVGMPYMGYDCNEVQLSISCSAKKSEFLIVFAKKLPAKNFMSTDSFCLNYYDIAKAAMQEAAWSCICVSWKWASELEKAAGNGDCRIFSIKSQRFQPIWTKAGRKKIWKTPIFADRSTESSSINWCKNISISKLTVLIVKTGLKNIAFAL